LHLRFAEGTEARERVNRAVDEEFRKFRRTPMRPEFTPTDPNPQPSQVTAVEATFAQIQRMGHDYLGDSILANPAISTK